jgi:hypothetical protein
VARSPDDRAASSSSAGVADVRGTKASPSLPSLAIPPEDPEGPRATVLVELDLQVARGPFCLAHDGIDPQRLEAAKRVAQRAPGFPQDFPRGPDPLANRPLFLALDPLSRANSGEPGRDHNPRVGGSSPSSGTRKRLQYTAFRVARVGAGHELCPNFVPRWWLGSE